MNQLVIFRALQGIGGSAIYSAVIVTLTTMVPVVSLFNAHLKFIIQYILHLGRDIKLHASHWHCLCSEQCGRSLGGWSDRFPYPLGYVSFRCSSTFIKDVIDRNPEQGGSSSSTYP